MKSLIMGGLCVAAAALAEADSLLTANTAAIDARARAEVARRHPDLRANDMVLTYMSWSRSFPESEFGQLSIYYDLPWAIATNTVQTVPLEKRLNVQVTMDESGWIRPGPSGVRTQIMTRSVARPEPGPESGKLILLNFKDSPLEHVLVFYADLKGLPLANEVSAPHEISCKSSSRLTVEQTFDFIDAVLAEQGIAIVEEKGSLRAVERAVGSPP